MSVDDKLWHYLIITSALIYWLGYSKLAFVYFIFNELYWEDDEEDDELDVQDEDILREDYNELDYQELPRFVTPPLINYNEGWLDILYILQTSIFSDKFFSINKFPSVFWFEWSKYREERGDVQSLIDTKVSLDDMKYKFFVK